MTIKIKIFLFNLIDNKNEFSIVKVEKLFISINISINNNKY